MCNFKVGDKVRVIADPDYTNASPVGTVVTIENISSDLEGEFDIWCDDDFVYEESWIEKHHSYPRELVFQ